MNDRLSKLLREADPGTVKRREPMSERGRREYSEYVAKEAELAQNARRDHDGEALPPPCRSRRRRVARVGSARSRELQIPELTP